MEARHGQSMQFGDLVLQFTDRFNYRWNDRGSGGSHDGSFWHPIPPAGFHALGSIGFAGYGDPNGNNWSLCVKEARAGGNALARPLGYSRVWSDRGSGADDDGSCWRPVPPDGYMILGDVFQRGYDMPSLDDVVCVRQDLITRGALGEFIWDDSGTGSDDDFGAWEIATMKGYTDGSKVALTPNTFFGAATHKTPQPVVYCLNLPVPVAIRPDPEVPVLESRKKPGEMESVVDRIVTVPFIAIKDDAFSLNWKLKNSPFYDVERWVDFSLVLFASNDSGSDQKSTSEVEVGVSKEKSETFEERTGISVSYEVGVEAMGLSSKISTTLSKELGFSTTTSVSNFLSQKKGVEMVTRPAHSAATWCARYQLQAVRSDNSVVGTPLAFDDNGSFYHSEYPRDAGIARVRVVNPKTLK